MSDIKRSCPGCDSWTSSVGIAFRDGEPCPYCGLPADAARLIDEARERHVGDEVLERLAQAERRAAEAESEAGRLRGLHSQLRTILAAAESGLGVSGD